MIILCNFFFLGERSRRSFVKRPVNSPVARCAARKFTRRNLMSLNVFAIVMLVKLFDDLENLIQRIVLNFVAGVRETLSFCDRESWNDFRKRALGKGENVLLSILSLCELRQRYSLREYHTQNSDFSLNCRVVVKRHLKRVGVIMSARVRRAN